MNTKTYQQLLSEFFEKYNNLIQKPSTRKKGHFKKALLKRRRRNKIAKETRRKQR